MTLFFLAMGYYFNVTLLCFKGDFDLTSTALILLESSLDVLIERKELHVITVCGSNYFFVPDLLEEVLTSDL